MPIMLTTAGNRLNSLWGMVAPDSRRDDEIMEFSGALRHWRGHSRLSQLELANRAGTTQRYLSFLESGRSTPGRAMVVRLAESMDLPLRDRNSLLAAAGYAPAYPESGLDDPVLAPVREAITHILNGHLPYPALVVDRHGDLIAANAAMDIITEGAAPELVGPGTNIYRLALCPDGIARRIRNFDQWARHVLQRVDPDLREELTPCLPDEPDGEPQMVAVPLHLASSAGELHLMTTVTTFATAVDITLAELKLEAFLPADQATAAALTSRGPYSPGNM